jgi:hypothetical protein
MSKRGYTHSGPLKGDMYLLCMLRNMNPMLWLTFPFELSSTTFTFRFEDFPIGVSAHIQPRSIQALTLRFINQT